MSFIGLSAGSSNRNVNRSRKIRQEEKFCRRREFERKYQELWNGVNNYYHSWDVKTNRFSSWESPDYYDSNYHAYLEKKQKKAKSEALAIRRVKLARLLEKESQEWENELKHRRKTFRFGKERIVDNIWSDLETLRLINEQAKARREEARRSEAKLRSHYCWKMNNPVLREFESKQKENFVRQAWQEQVEEKRIAEEENMRVEKEDLTLRNQMLKEELEKDKQKQEELRDKQAKYKEELLSQHLNQLKEKEQLASDLVKEESRVLREKDEVEKLFSNQRLMEERRKKEALRLSLTKQIQLKLRRTARETRERLDEDMKLLNAAIEEEQKISESERRKKIETKAWMEEAYQIFKKQAEEAVKQEEETQSLFHEEAVRMWKRHEERWRKEQEARDKLMQEVLQTLKLQVQERLENNYKEQKELLESRGRLLQEADDLQKEIMKKKEESSQIKADHQMALLKQIEEKQNMKEEIERQEEMERNAMKEKDKKETEKLLEEIRNMKLIDNPMKQPYPRRVW